jgi:dTDP-4-amino-4,6-dideoxygalactose transaminase
MLSCSVERKPCCGPKSAAAWPEEAPPRGGRRCGGKRSPRREGLLLVADAAQSFGASLDGEKVGTLADYTATSFYPSKPLGGYGDGGAVFTCDEARASRLRALRNHGKGPDMAEIEYLGLNSRLDSIQAAILLEKLKLFPAEILARQQCADRYNERLAAVAEVPHLMPGATSVWAQYTIVTEQRDALAAACREAGGADGDPLRARAQHPAALPGDADSPGRRAGGREAWPSG